MHITFEREGPGAFTDEELDGMLTRDARGKISGLNLPKRAVLISNHQARAHHPITAFRDFLILHSVHRSIQTGGTPGA